MHMLCRIDLYAVLSNIKKGVVEMKNIILIFFLTINILNAWEVTTHRAIDIQALKVVEEENLKDFIDNV